VTTKTTAKLLYWLQSATTIANTVLRKGKDKRQRTKSDQIKSNHTNPKEKLNNLLLTSQNIQYHQKKNQQIIIRIVRMAPTFSGGKLNLKGSKKGKKKNKKSKHKLKRKEDEEKIRISNDENDNNGDDDSSNDTDNDNDNDNDDGLTPSERKSLKLKKERERIELEKLGSKSHRERVEEFNDKLGNLTEHNDIPRVSPVILVVIA
jgi:protein FAM32A